MIVLHCIHQYTGSLQHVLTNNLSNIHTCSFYYSWKNLLIHRKDVMLPCPIQCQDLVENGLIDHVSILGINNFKSLNYI